MHGQHATKGIFITTSDFSRDANDYVAKIGSKIVLIDKGPEANDHRDWQGSRRLLVVAWIKRLGLLELATSGTGQEDAVLLNTEGETHFILVSRRAQRIESCKRP
jgi:hypothetical protein